MTKYGKNNYLFGHVWVWNIIKTVGSHYFDENAFYLVIIYEININPSVEW